MSFKTVHIGEHVYNVPSAPTSAIKIPSSLGGEWEIPLDELILNGNLPAENAYWKRSDLPKFFYKYIPDETLLFMDETEWDGNYLICLSDEDTNRLIYLMDREMYRRRHGVHFKNKHDIEYLTGDHYFFLQHVKPYGLNAKMHKYTPWREVGYEYGEFRKFQRDVFYLIEKCNNDDDILGLFVAKPKKTGITQCFAAYYLNKATMTRMGQMGIMSKGKDASAVNMLMFQHGLNSLPEIFKPIVRDLAAKTGDMFFGEPALKNVRTKAGKERRKQLMDARPLNTRVWAALTKAAGFDSPTMTDVWLDELPKYWSSNGQSPLKVFLTNQEVVKIQDIINGKFWITSYPPEEDDLGFREAKDIYYNAKLKTIPPGGKRTKNELICFYISSKHSYTSCFDKYGDCNEVEALRLNREARDKVKNDPREWQAKVRQYSETESECWGSGGGASVFNPVRIKELRDKLDEDMRSERFFAEGKLEWVNKQWEYGLVKRPRKHFGSVEFVPATAEDIREGKESFMREYQRMPKGYSNRPLLMGRDDDNNLLPPEMFTNFGAVDPTDYAAESEVIQGSKNASYTLNFPDPIMDRQYGRLASKVILTETFIRPEDPDDFYEHVVKEIIYHGKIVIVEANKAWVATELIKDGLGYYMLVIDKEDGVLKPWLPYMDYNLIRTTADILESIVRYVTAYIKKPTLESGQNDYGAQIKSERLLEQLSQFTKANSKLYDLVMALGLALICGEIMMATPMDQEDRDLYGAATVNAVYDYFANL